MASFPYLLMYRYLIVKENENFKITKSLGDKNFIFMLMLQHVAKLQIGNFDQLKTTEKKNTSTHS